MNTLSVPSIQTPSSLKLISVPYLDGHVDEGPRGELGLVADPELPVVAPPPREDPPLSPGPGRGGGDRQGHGVVLAPGDLGDAEARQAGHQLELAAVRLKTNIAKNGGRVKKKKKKGFKK